MKRYLYLTPLICYQLQNQTNSLSTKDFIFVITIDMSTITCYHCLEQVLLTSLWSGCYRFKVILTIICKKFWCCHWFFIACCHAIAPSLFIITFFIAPLLFVFVALFIAPPTSCICDIVHCAIVVFFILCNVIVVCLHHCSLHSSSHHHYSLHYQDVQIDFLTLFNNHHHCDKSYTRAKTQWTILILLTT